MTPDDYIVNELSAVSLRCEILQDINRDLIELAKSLRRVLDEYIDTTDPDENEWTAQNWNLQKQRIRRSYDEVMLKCATYEVEVNA